MGELWERSPLFPGDQTTTQSMYHQLSTVPQKDTMKSITLPWSTGEKEEKFYTSFMSIPLNSAATDTHTHTHTHSVQIKHKDLLEIISC